MVKRLLVYLILGGALALPASASANTDFLNPISPPTEPAWTYFLAYAPAAHVAKVRTTTSPSGFDWGDAAIGAAVTLGACGLGAALLYRRGPARLPRAG